MKINMNRTLLRLLNKLISQILIFSFIFPLGIFAEEANKKALRKDANQFFKELSQAEKEYRKNQRGENQKPKFDGSTLVGVVNGAAGLAGGVLNMYNQQMNQQLQQRRMQETQQRMTPKFRPDEYFPHCQTLPAEDDEIMGLCEGSLPTDPNSMMQDGMQAMQYSQIAEKMEKEFYRNYLSTNRVVNKNVGSRCFEDAMERNMNLPAPLPAMGLKDYLEYQKNKLKLLFFI